jgi:hypothetical protein
MSAGLFDHDAAHLMGDVAVHPIEQPWNVLAALFLLAGRSQPRRHALPAHPRATPWRASSHRIQAEPMPLGRAGLGLLSEGSYPRGCGFKMTAEYDIAQSTH